jgi:hypothetical protein
MSQYPLVLIVYWVFRNSKDSSDSCCFIELPFTWSDIGFHEMTNQCSCWMTDESKNGPKLRTIDTTRILLSGNGQRQDELFPNFKKNYNLIFIFFFFWLINWLFTVLRPAQEFFTYMETSPLPVKGCKI